jgi:hypothetical protein
MILIAKNAHFHREIGFFMGYKLNWHVDKHVIHLKFYDTVTADDLTNFHKEMPRFVAEGIQPVHVLIDTTDVKSFPSNLRWVIHMLQGNPVKASGYRIAIGSDPTIRTLITTILGVIHVPVLVCDSLAEADELLTALNVPVPAAVG